MIIPSLYERQKQRGGYLTRDDMQAVAERLSVPLHQVNALVTFFPHFRTEPPADAEVHICRDMSCHMAGSRGLIEDLSNWAVHEHGDRVAVCGVSCLGRCDRGPAAMVNDQLVASADLSRLQTTVNELVDGGESRFDSDWDVAKGHIGQWDMDIYKGEGQYEIVRQFLTENAQPKRVIGALEKAGLLGMGGAGGRAYLKWNDVLQAKGTTGEKYIVCNADESEPGTFKDRDILLAAPHLVIEGMITAALVVGARRGWIYIRHEYHEQMEACRQEIRRARSLGACGRSIFGTSRSFELEIFPSPGGYICGEQTALIEAMENKRAEPRNRPPELMTNGYRDQPTLLSNVETFAWVPAILRDDGEWFAQQGHRDGPLTEGSRERMKGKRLFSISGDVAKPGVYEVATGITLGQLIDEHAGGMKDGQAFQAVALSGPSGGLLPAQIPVSALNARFVEQHVPSQRTHIDVRDLPLDINVSRAVGYMLGAGIVVYGSSRDILAEAVANSHFFYRETCGKCVPCRLGSQKITQIGERLLAGEIDAQELTRIQPLVADLSGIMKATSICGLGQVASNPIQTVLRFFPERAHDACRNTSGDV